MCESCCCTTELVLRGREPLDAGCDRRAFLALLGATFIAGCASTPEARVTLPGADAPSGPLTPTPAPPVEAAKKPTNALEGATFPGVKPRSAWTKAGPDTSVMNPMLPVRFVTVHHDGLDQLIETTNEHEMAERIEIYRAGHRAKGWGDIGYHFVIDRAGNVWEARSLKWQGAHVKNRNEGNVGIVMMGNFQVQKPTAAQMKALRNHLRAVCAYFSVPWTRVFSHGEWPGASTECPGRNLEREFVALRRAEGGAS